MSLSPARHPGKQASLVPRVKVWLEAEGRYAFGFGLCQMLQAVDQTGSIKQAAANIGKSYRYVWGRIKAAEKVLGTEIVEAHVGGAGVQRSNLTLAARQLVVDFLAIRARMMEVAHQEFSQRFRTRVKARANRH